MSDVKIRRTRIDAGYCEAKGAWSQSTLTFKDYRAPEGKEVIITIEDPWQLVCIREQLDKIAAYWDERLKMVRHTREG